LIAVAVVAALAAAHPIWLAALGAFLVKADPPAPAEIVVVLGGDFFGHRIETAAELVKRGWAPKVLVSGPFAGYGLSETDLAIPYMVKKGYPREWFIPFVHGATSTDEEARMVLPELRRRGVHRFLLVTTNFHTRRAGRIFRSLGRDFEMRVVEAPDEYFRPNDWWRYREARKVFLIEWLKTITGPLGV
jgi:uncharacterized SAM-binding protein YcdF (DUF218 family)